MSFRKLWIAFGLVIVLYFFVSVAFWNLVGAGLFGFMINPPIALYFAFGAIALAVFVIGLRFGATTRNERFTVGEPAAAPGR
jgi:hypothetical protein